ncbi:UDP-N-acetylmuramoyl-tripeptide--D-alanyl-D-alanine ligase [Corynebacterium sp. TAE3-ERU2]|uniref:UDP-N-acetylmuramoyl-tripeptide--D-alanyl-D- alanine ligase n=1 Tax=Corynebacterium sp. TAE3-ERU2 TaxID=2849497 RepID=UPI001C43BBDF|nr:UDP-N-acetylmuramoyl-tripeptide--D-alanyl-D-alanine ligase [Corynebacterium sp. TAE3-ERU2]MBV7301297.1 UDP-N-acetylmuramoyl-tripeptide--D-alanyl-D-alanine ligase [Corynebacterium sp. TAE3-ERU2]
MKKYTLAQIAEITGGELSASADPESIVTGPVEFDSRNVAQGSLFVALPGANVDGHDFVPTALESGATAALVAQEVEGPAIVLPVTELDRSMDNAYAFAVDTTGRTEAVVGGLAALARRNTAELQQQHGLKVVGVTGSAGKTSTKDFLATLLRSVAETVAPPGSFNNEIGLPYTALKCDEDTTYLISEMSARGIGHIRHLTEITRPDIAVVLNVGSAHLGEFGSRENIATAKGEIIEALPADGVAVLNADDELVAQMAQTTAARVLFTSAALDGRAPQPQADITATEVRVDELARPRFVLTTPSGSADVQLQVSGEHQVYNALATAAVGHAVGLECAQIAAALSAHTAASANRMAITTRSDGVVIINDSYNANPDSMRAGIKTLASTAAAAGTGSWAILGQMAELGEDAISAHEDLGQVLLDQGIDHLITVGTDVNTHALAGVAEELGIDTHIAEGVDGALNIIAAGVEPGEVVLVKASNADRLWYVAEQLAQLSKSR